MGQFSARERRRPEGTTTSEGGQTRRGAAGAPSAVVAPPAAPTATNLAWEVSHVVGGPVAPAGQPPVTIELDPAQPWVVTAPAELPAAALSTALYGGDYSALMRTDLQPWRPDPGRRRFVIIQELLLPAWRARFHAAMRRVLDADVRHVEDKLLEERIDADDEAELMTYVQWWSGRRDLRTETGESYFDAFLTRLAQDHWVRDYGLWEGSKTSFLESLHEEVEERSGELAALIAGSSVQRGAYRPAWTALDISGRPIPGGAILPINKDLVQRSAATVLDRLEGFTSADDSKVISDLLTGLPAPELAKVLDEVMRHHGATKWLGLVGKYGEAWGPGMLYWLFEDLTDEDGARVAEALKRSGVLATGTVDALVAGRGWGGKYLPWTTRKAQEAAEFWADATVNADSWLAKAGSAVMGGFASLWLPETAGTTVLTLATAGASTPVTGAFALVGKAFPTVSKVLTVAGTGVTSFNVTIAVQNVATGEDVWTGRKLSDEEIVGYALQATSGVLFLGASFLQAAAPTAPTGPASAPPPGPGAGGYTGPRLVYSGPGAQAPSAAAGGPAPGMARETRVVFQAGPRGEALRAVVVEVPVTPQPVAPQPARPPLVSVPPAPAGAPATAVAPAAPTPIPPVAPAVGGAVLTTAAPVPTPGPGQGPGSQQRFPSGLQPGNVRDYIPITWFKPLWVYRPVRLVDHWGDARAYDMTTPGQTVEPGHDIGVAPLFLPWIGKAVQPQFVLQQDDRGPAVDRFRSLLVRHGWTQGGTHEIDHVQELLWSGHDQDYNLWPLDAVTNGLAGNRFMNFRVTYSNVPGGGPATPATTNVRITDGIRAPWVNNLLRRWFIITSISPP
jgi:hypothetical protein